MLTAGIRIFGKNNTVLAQFTTDIASKLENEIILRELWNLKEVYNRMFDTKIEIELKETTRLELKPWFGDSNETSRS